MKSAGVHNHEEKAFTEINEEGPERKFPMIEIWEGKCAREGCRNSGIDAAALVRGLEEWASRNATGERIAAKLGPDKSKAHHGIKIAVAGCANCRSRPQIADLGLIGFVRPEFDPSECRECGSCMLACPDRAIEWDGGYPVFNREKCLGCNECRDVCPAHSISLSGPWIKVIAGGKLGRRPRLGGKIAEVSSAEEAIGLVERIIGDYLENGARGERFADYWPRAGKGRVK